MVAEAPDDYATPIDLNARRGTVPHDVEVNQLRAHIAMLEARATAAEERVSVLLTQLGTTKALLATRSQEYDDYKKRVLGERTFLRRGDITPTQKVVYLLTLWEMGASFDNPNTTRTQEFKTIPRKALAAQAGVTENVIGAQLEAMSADRTETFTPWLRRREVTKRKADTGVPYRVYQFAPPEGLDYLATLKDPATLPVPPKPESNQKAATRVAQTRREEKRIVAEAARLIAARCPHCQSLDVGLKCRACGCVTAAVELPDLQDTTRDITSSEVKLRTHADITSSEVKLRTPIDTVSTYREEVVKGAGTESAPLPLLDDDPDEPFSPVCEDMSPWAADDPEEPRAPEPPITAADVAHLVADEALAAVLALAVTVWLPAVSACPDHTVMQRRKTAQTAKYLTHHESLTGLALAEHFVGAVTRGAGLLTSPLGETPRRCRSLAFDSDDSFNQLIVAARRLAEHDITPILVQNPTKSRSGHLWVLFDGDVEPGPTRAILERWAPTLAGIPECFPKANQRDGAHVRLPGGCYLAVGESRSPVQLAVGGQDGPPEWINALDPMAWVCLAAASSPVAALSAAWIAPEARAQPAAPPVAPKPVSARAHPAPAEAGTIEAAVAAFNRAHPIAQLVDITKAHMFRSPWHEDSSPSCRAYDNGTWCDFSNDNKGGDALALYCALNDLWPRVAEKPDRVAALGRLGLWGPRKPGCALERRGDDLLVRLHHPDRAAWDRAKASFTSAIRQRRYAAEDKAWLVPRAQEPAVRAWAASFAASERARGTVS